MMFCPDKYKKPVENVNETFKALRGDLPDKQAKITLTRFLRANLAFTTELISGIRLAPYQEITLKGFFNRNFSMCIWGRGCAKTFIATVYCFLQCIFEPNTKILIAGPTFRTARAIFNELDKMVNAPGAQMLLQAFSIGRKERRSDLFEWEINGGSIRAIPLNGEKIRGFRANVILLDEFLLLPEDIVKNVLMPFLVAPQNMKERIEIRELEDGLIKEGRMTESQRMVFENNSKMIALSSASYTFENLYKTYCEWISKINMPGRGDATYFVSQLGYEALPLHMIDKTIIEEAQNGGSSHAAFKREYRAEFTDGSDSYFSAQKMLECTVPDGSLPTARLYGEKRKKYILAIDPSFSNSPTSDYFAMAVLAINDDDTTTLVHNYAVAGGDLKDHIKYLFYIITNFDIHLLVIDNAGWEFITAANEAECFRKLNIELKFIDFETDKEGSDYDEALRAAKQKYNRDNYQICIKQFFTTAFIRRANEHLQTCIDHKRLWFASKIQANDEALEEQAKRDLALDAIGYDNAMEFIDAQDDLIYQVKKQCALIEVKTNPTGSQTFDLPQHLKRSSSAQRARKDNYTALMLGIWGVKCYHDLVTLKVETGVNTFVPKMIW